MTTIGTATLQIIPSLLGVSEAIEKQLDGKVVEVKVAPKVDQKAAEQAGTQVKAAVEKQTAETKIAPKVDAKAAADAGKQTKEAVEKQTKDVKVTPKVDTKAADTAGRSAKASVEKHTKDVAVEPKVDTRGAEQAGKTTGEAVTKGAKDAVRKGDIGKTVSDEVTKTVEKASPGRDLAKILVDGLAEGVKGELGGGSLVDALVNGLADGVKYGIDEVQISQQTVDAITNGFKSAPGAIKDSLKAAPGAIKDALKSAPGAIKDVFKSGNLAGAIKDSLKAAPGAIKDALRPGISVIGGMIRAGASEWSAGIAEALRGGDIEGATTDIGNTVRATTNVIANIGSTFGLQLDGVREFGDGSATTLETVGTNVQGIVDKATDMRSKFVDTGELLGTVLPGRAGDGAKSIINSLGTIIPIATGVYEALDKITQEWHAGQQERFWARWEADNRARDLGLKPPQPGVGDFGGPPAVGQGNAPAAPPSSAIVDDLRAKIQAGDSGQLPPGFSVSPKGDIVGPDGTVIIPGRSSGGYTGSLPIDQIAGVVHGKEFVVKALSQERIENDHPGLLDHMNQTGKLPGYAGGGLVAGTAELRKIIGEKFGISNIGGYRPGGDGFNEHSTGRALDVMVGNDRAKGDAVKDFVLANAPAIDLKWVIWRQHLSYPGGGGYDMPDRGSPTQNHMDHVHIFSGPGIANGLRGALKGQQPQQSANAGPGAIDPNSTDATAAAPAEASKAGSIRFNLPSSISGLPGIGLDGMGVTTKVNGDSPERTLDLGGVASQAIGGQVSSALSAFGVPNAPGWLQGISRFVSGISVGGGSGGYGGAAPVAAVAPVSGAPALPAGDMHGSQAGRQPGPAGPTYNIRTATVEDAFVQAQRRENVRLASKVDRY